VFIKLAKTTKTPSETIASSIKKQFKELIIEQIKISTQGVNEQILEYQKTLLPATTKKGVEQKMEEQLATSLFGHFCSDYRKGIAGIVAAMWKKDNADNAYFDHLYKVYKTVEGTIDEDYYKFKDFQFTLVKPIKNDNSHDYPLNKVCILTDNRQGYFTRPSSIRVIKGNHMTTQNSSLDIVTDAEITAFIESDLFGKYLEKLSKDKEAMTKFVAKLLIVES